MEYTRLLSRGYIGRMETKNRIVMAPMVRNYADEHGMVTPKYLAHMKRIAQGGVGMMVLDAAYISPEGKGFTNQIGIHTDETIAGLREVVNAAHEEGAVVGPQIHHAGRQTRSQVTGTEIVAPSAIPDPVMNELPRALEVSEIARLVQAYGDAAGRAKEAGCDFVEVHGAHGYLITQFLSPYSNHRDDEYGGTDDGRMRFLVEVVEAVRNAVGDDFPIVVRLSGDEMVPNGLTIEDTKRIAKRLKELGVNAVHVSAGNYASFDRGYLIAPMAIDDGPIVHLAREVKETVNIPVIAVGKIRTPELAEDILSAGKADFIALARMFLSDPDWPKKVAEGRWDEINKCIACNQGCISRLFLQQDVWCTVNPETAREEEFARIATDDKKRVFIAGGGPAGMEAARYAAKRGNHVVLCERLDRLGGQLVAASAAPFRIGWEELRQYLIREMARLGVDVRLNTEATVEMAKDEGADIAIVAVGASQITPDIPGIEHGNIVTAVDILEGRVEAKGEVVVAGGGCSGAQTAEFLAARGHRVTIVEMLGEIAQDAAAVDRALLVRRLEERGVEMRTETKIMAIEPHKVAVEHAGQPQEIPADTVVLCLGSKSNDGIKDALAEVVRDVIVVGDAVEPRKVTEAIVEGARAGIHQRSEVTIKAA